MSLSELNIGKEGRIVHIDLDKSKKGRFNGLGIIKNAEIKTLSKGWGIKVYEIRGTHIAIRNEDAAKIFII